MPLVLRQYFNMKLTLAYYIHISDVRNKLGAPVMCGHLYYQQKKNKIK